MEWDCGRPGVEGAKLFTISKKNFWHFCNYTLQLHSASTMDMCVFSVWPLNYSNYTHVNQKRKRNKAADKPPPPPKFIVQHMRKQSIPLMHQFAGLKCNKEPWKYSPFSSHDRWSHPLPESTCTHTNHSNLFTLTLNCHASKQKECFCSLPDEGHCKGENGANEPLLLNCTDQGLHGAGKDQDDEGSRNKCNRFVSREEGIGVLSEADDDLM